MYIDTETRDFFRVLLTRGMQVDLGGYSIKHTHNKVDDLAPRPPVKFHLCTSQSRPEGRLVQTEIDMIGRLCWRYARQKRLHMPAFASVEGRAWSVSRGIGVNLLRVILLQQMKKTVDGAGLFGILVGQQGPIELILRSLEFVQDLVKIE